MAHEKHPESLTVIVITYHRSDSLQICLEHLMSQEMPVDQILVVDGSTGDLSRQVCRRFPAVTYVHHPAGDGNMTSSRNEGLANSSGEIVAFLDDDAYARPQWSSELLAAFARNPGAGAVGGRTLDGLPDEEVATDQPIGSMTSRGRLIAKFAEARPGDVTILHGIGANMSFRGSVLQQLGGMRQDWPVPALREDTDMFLRVAAAGHPVIFASDAVVRHVGAPHKDGKRFDTRYARVGQRNHLVLLGRNFGIGSRVFWAYLFDALIHLDTDRHRSTKGRLLRMLVNLVGVVQGLAASARLAGWSPTSPVLEDERAAAVRAGMQRARQRGATS